jgi:hypothetical protein
MIILLILYFIQGAIVAFSIITVIILLVEKQVPYNDLAIIASAGLPFALKLFFAPLLDTYYS